MLFQQSTTDRSGTVRFGRTGSVRFGYPTVHRTFSARNFDGNHANFDVNHANFDANHATSNATVREWRTRDSVLFVVYLVSLVRNFCFVVRTCLGSISNTNLYLIRRILLRIISHSSNKKSNLEFFRCSCTVRFGRTVRPNRFGSVRFGSVRFCIKGSADHRTFNMPGSVVL